MTPVPVSTDAPLRPEHPSGITPKTMSSNNEQSYNLQSPPNAYTPASPTAPVSNSGPPPAQPGARPTPTCPVYQPNSNPPPPQPGAVPQVTKYHTTTYTYQPQQSQPAKLPPQWAIPPPAQAQAPSHSTDTNASTSTKHTRSKSLFQQPIPSPLKLPYHNGDLRRHSLGNSNHYAQNPYFDRTVTDRERRASLEDKERSEGEGEWWKAAKGLVQNAGEKLAEVERGVWRWAKGK
jgi:hypothetical protein